MDRTKLLQCNDCGIYLPDIEMCHTGEQGTGFECEPCFDTGVENQ